MPWLGLAIWLDQFEAEERDDNSQLRWPGRGRASQEEEEQRLEPQRREQDWPRVWNVWLNVWRASPGWHCGTLLVSRRLVLWPNVQRLWYWLPWLLRVTILFTMDITISWLHLDSETGRQRNTPIQSVDQAVFPGKLRDNEVLQSNHPGVFELNIFNFTHGDIQYL